MASVRTLVSGWIGTVLSAVLVGGGAAGVAGAEPAGCAAGSTPVVILAGGGISGGAAWFEPLRSALESSGRCAYYLPYGVVDGTNGMTSVADAAREIDPALARIRAESASGTVDIVAHSLGALVTHYYAKFLGGAPHLAHVALIGPVSAGTELEPLVPGGVSELEQQLPGTRAVLAGATGLVPPLHDVLVGSEVITALRTGGLTQPGVRYCVLASRGELWNTPIETAQFIAEPGVSNDIFEDIFPGVESDHNDMTRRPETAQWVRDCLR